MFNRIIPKQNFPSDYSRRMVDCIIPRARTIVHRQRSLRAPLLPIAAKPKQLTLAAPPPLVLMPSPRALLQHVVTTAPMIVDARLCTCSGRRAAGEREPVALAAPAPVVLTPRAPVVLREQVFAAADIDVGAAGRAAHVAIETEDLTLLAPAPLVLAQGCIAVDRQFVVAAAAVVVLVPGRAWPR